MNTTRKLGWVATASLLGAALIAPSASLATDLNQTPPITASTQESACEGDEGLEPGQVLWHFILTDAESAGAMITVEFAEAGVVGPQAADKVSGNATHFNIITSTGTDEQLLSASTDIDGNLLNLSHVCYGMDEEPSVPVETEEPSVPVETEEPSVPVETEEPSVPVETEEPSVPVETETPDGSVQAETGTPEEQATPPSTDTIANPNTASGNGWQLILLGLGALMATALVLTPSRARR